MELLCCKDIGAQRGEAADPRSHSKLVTSPSASQTLSLCVCDFSAIPLESLYVASSCQLRRLESARYSCVCSHVAETFQGGPVVRAFRVQGPFVAQNDAHVDESQRVSFPRLVADR